MRRSTRDWIIIVLILAGIWFLVDGGWLTTNPSAGTYWSFGSLISAPLLLAGLFLWASSPATPLLAVEPTSASKSDVRPMHFPVSPIEPSEDGPPRRIARKWIAVVGVVFVMLLTES